MSVTDKALKTFEMWCYRKMTGIRLVDKCLRNNKRTETFFESCKEKMRWIGGALDKVLRIADLIMEGAVR